MADDDEEVRCKVTHVVTGEETCWIKTSGYIQVVYPNGHSFMGNYDEDKIKQGRGTYLWMGPTSEDDDTPIELASFEGTYKDGQKTGYGRMVYPTGDTYAGDWFENKMQGDGTYTYKKTGDVYFGAWYAGQKHGSGRYQFGTNDGSMEGDWENGQIIKGTWKLANASVYTGEFKGGRPYGAGKFDFIQSGLTQKGDYVESKPVEGEDEETEQGEGEPPRVPKVEWKGQSLVAF